MNENPGVTDLQHTRLRHLADRLAEAADHLPRWHLSHNLDDGYLAHRPGWDTDPQPVLPIDRGRLSDPRHATSPRRLRRTQRGAVIAGEVPHFAA